MRFRILSTVRRGFTLIEMIVSAGLGTLLMVALISVSISIQRSIKGTEHYLASTNNSNRLIDHVAQDLRRAVRVGTLAGGIYTPLKNASSFAVSETVSLVINVPDVYASNAPNNGAQAPYKVSRYNRAALNTQVAYNAQSPGSILNGCVPYAEAVTRIGTKEVLRYAPASAGSGEIQVRYSRGPRSATDPTICFFRAEYPTGSNTPFAAPREIAHQAVTGDVSTNLIVTLPNLAASAPGYQKTFQLESSFVPRYQRTASTAPAAAQNVTIVLRNNRRD